MGTSRNGRCEVRGTEYESRYADALQWGPPGMGGVRAKPRSQKLGRRNPLQWGPPGMGGVRARF